LLPLALLCDSLAGPAFLHPGRPRATDDQILGYYDQPQCITPKEHAAGLAQVQVVPTIVPSIGRVTVRPTDRETDQTKAHAIVPATVIDIGPVKVRAIAQAHGPTGLVERSQLDFTPAEHAIVQAIVPATVTDIVPVKV
jgi:hypothetical protein